ncbi:MAG: hypothetical protein V3W41_07205 [Planctomycetota bacterium]
MSILAKAVLTATNSKTCCLALLVLGLVSLMAWKGLSDASAATPEPDVVRSSAAEAVKVTIVTSSQVYYPSTIKKNAKFKKPAVLSTSTVFDSIAEWKTIKKKKLSDKDAEYHLLLKKANDKFAKALKTVQRDGSYDIIAETGAITCKGCTAKDVNKDLVDALP